MLDPNTLDPKWTLLLGLPIIAGLLSLAWRRSRALAAHIREVREEMARHPQDPYAALAALHHDRGGKTGNDTEPAKRTRGPRWRKD